MKQSFLEDVMLELIRIYWGSSVGDQVRDRGRRLSGKESTCNAGDLQETWIWFLGQEDPLEKKMATDSSILAWEISWTEEPGRLQFIGSQRVWQD